MRMVANNLWEADVCYQDLGGEVDGTIPLLSSSQLRESYCV